MTPSELLLVYATTSMILLLWLTFAACHLGPTVSTMDALRVV